MEKHAGSESLCLAVQPNSLIAVKIVGDRGIESLKVIAGGVRELCAAENITVTKLPALQATLPVFVGQAFTGIAIDLLSKEGF